MRINLNNLQGNCMFKIKNYLFAVLALSFGILNINVAAQEASADENVEEVVITGSRIKRDSLNLSLIHI